MNGNHMILEAPAEKVQNNQIGAIPFTDLIGIWTLDPQQNKYINHINYYRSLYQQIHPNQDSEEINTPKKR